MSAPVLNDTVISPVVSGLPPTVFFVATAVATCVAKATAFACRVALVGSEVMPEFASTFAPASAAASAACFASPRAVNNAETSITSAANAIITKARLQATTNMVTPCSSWLATRNALFIAG